MIAGKKELILRELEEGTGAAIGAAVDSSGLRTGLRIWFGDLDEKHGPVAELRPYGLKGHRINLFFGNFSGEVIAQIRQASLEDIQLAHALVASVPPDVEIEIQGQSLTDWIVTNGAFRLTAIVRDQQHLHDDAAVIATCRNVIVPIMAAMAELIGYDVIVDTIDEEAPVVEGAILQSTIQRRERNPRNRLLCIRIHGERCLICGLEPRLRYGDAGSIIEVHHLEPLAMLSNPRPYDPRTDLIPLCPSCHRAVHTKRPPFSVEELRSLMESCRD